MINTIETKHGDFDIAMPDTVSLTDFSNKIFIVMETRIRGTNKLIVPSKLTVHSYKFNLQ